ncbi:uncharacterized protein DUF1838 [Thermosporothrix hazakensis]|uniref:Uncharacterized protein DUF1838 n=2 Tax=Thermosporothrix TaxID=768650 RepID=A0A326U0F7_THEHA|nr:DUF1838 family protein [Thermosporothrix hazakensis]PZW23606.1 uncharacterized protein DUF1838 [Thermosporothrix hazakensis]BBH86724.1 hypothetical protein KTC_14750 [Thermosporothrix sp. COM3]GCE51027.1 hypothetical protein KTH_58960 [Thermosporothrix hazakensis]
MNNPEQMLTHFVKLRGSLKQEDVVFYWSGSIYGMIPGVQNKPLFRFEGYNISRFVPVEGGYQHLSREVSVYEDPRTGEILERWQNPFTEQEVRVVHVWNDPVNQEMLLNGPRGPFTVPVTPVGDDIQCWNLDIFLTYPSPLSRKDYPQYSQNDLYQGAELFQFYVKTSDLENEDLPSVPCHLSWTRIGPWLPWMEMADRPGNLVYQCRGYKLANGYADLPSHLRAYVEQHEPQYKEAPRTFTRPNETSWTYFKKLLAQQ